jgi:VIT1/CCC1 family predicted Fe2+/Mn2+ transporter
VGILLLLLGIGRGLVSHRNVILTALETVGIAMAAALAGAFIGKLIG